MTAETNDETQLPTLPPRAGGTIELLQAALPGFYAFALIVAIAFEGGGFDAVVRGETGLLIWWGLLLAAIVGLIGFGRLSRPAKVVLALLGALAAWSLLSAVWSESAGRSVTEAARIVTYAGVLLAGLYLARGDGVRSLLVGVGLGVATVGLASLGSRLIPELAPEPGALEALLGEADERLNYPLDYWNGLATLIAMGLPIIAHLATRGRSLVGVLAATAALPALGFAMYMTLSRGGIAAGILGAVAFFAVYPQRRRLALVSLIAGAGLLALIVLASSRQAFLDGISEGAGADQAREMLLFTVIVCALVAGGRYLLTRTGRYERSTSPGPLARLDRGRVLKVGAPVLAIVIAAGLALGGAGWADQRWEEFKSAENPAGTERLVTAGGTGRYQWWSEAVDAGRSEPLIGIGAGTYEFWWAREGTIPGFVRDAHSLYLEAFGELGVPGFLLVVALVLTIIGVAARRAWLGPDRALIAAGLGSLVAFAFAAGVDWAWEQAVLPIGFMLVAAAVLSGPAASAGPGPGSRLRSRIPAVLVALAAALVVGVPLFAESRVRDSQAEFRAGDLGGALNAADSAVDLEPWAARPRLQQALVLRALGDLEGAREAAEEAIDREETNWQNWLILAQIEDSAGDTEAAEAALARARELNPRSPLFT